jgi:hypothetical protein
MYENGDRNSQSTEICFQFYPNIKLGLFNRSHLCISQIIVHLENTVNFRSTESYFSDCFHHFPTHSHRRSFCRGNDSLHPRTPLILFFGKSYMLPGYFTSSHHQNLTLSAFLICFFSSVWFGSVIFLWFANRTPHAVRLHLLILSFGSMASWSHIFSLLIFGTALFFNIHCMFALSQTTAFPFTLLLCSHKTSRWGDLVLPSSILPFPCCFV